MTEPSAATAPVPPDTASAAEDYVDIFLAPAKVFARRAKGNPMGSFLVVWVMLSVLFFAGRGALAPIMDAEIQTKMEAQMKTNPQLTPELAEKMKPMMSIGITVGGVVGVPILLLIVSLIAWILGRFIMSTALTYSTALLIVSFAWVPRIIEGVINLCQGLLLDVTKMSSHYQLSLGVARFLDPAKTPPALMIVAGQVDLFAIWTAVLIVIGMIHAGKLEKNKAIVVGVVIWLCGMLPALWA
jgi:hypothetical protein